jgi:hypothetical protein
MQGKLTELLKDCRIADNDYKFEKKDAGEVMGSREGRNLKRVFLSSTVTRRSQ